MKTLTKSKAIAYHRKMWHWIADKTLKYKRKVTKEDYFDAKHIKKKDRPFCNCYCCEYVEQGFWGCDICPVEWGDIPHCVGVGYPKSGLYKRWDTCSDYKTAARLARQIAELPEKG